MERYEKIEETNWLSIGIWEGADVAAKKIQSESDDKEFLEEAIMLQTISHPHIVVYHGIFIDDKKTTWIITEYMSEGGLDRLLRVKKEAFSQNDLINISKQICSGMIYLSQQGIIHVKLYLFLLFM